MELFTVREASQRAVETVRETSLPVFIESTTYRFRGHSMADAGRYRTPEEVKEWQQRDPLQIYIRRLEEDGVFDPELRESIDQEVIEEVERATEFALNSPDPDTADLYKYVYTEDGR